jgi:hypothetical protein
MRALSIDHINGGGTAHVRALGIHPSDFYQWLKDHGYPEGFQVLCMNCNWIKKAENGECCRRLSKVVIDKRELALKQSGTRYRNFGSTFGAFSS